MILIGSVCLKTTFDEMAENRRMADWNEWLTNQVANVQLCSAVAKFTDKEIFLPPGSCLWDLGDSTQDILVGAGSKKTTVLTTEGFISLEPFHSIGGITFQGSNEEHLSKSW